MDSIKTIVTEVTKAIDKKNGKLCYDKTFPSVVHGINDNGTYVIIKERQKYDVKCCNPALEIKIGMPVWVKMPCGQLKDMYIEGVRQ